MVRINEKMFYDKFKMGGFKENFILILENLMEIEYIEKKPNSLESLDEMLVELEFELREKKFF